MVHYFLSSIWEEAVLLFFDSFCSIYHACPQKAKPLSCGCFSAASFLSLLDRVHVYICKCIQMLVYWVKRHTECFHMGVICTSWQRTNQQGWKAIRKFSGTKWIGDVSYLVKKKYLQFILLKPIYYLQGFFLGEAFSTVLAKILQKLLDPHSSCFAFREKSGDMQWSLDACHILKNYQNITCEIKRKLATHP